MTKTLLILIFSTISFSLSSQSLIDIINRTEKAVFEVRAYNNNGADIGGSTGFFISPNGLAITLSSNFEYADSAIVISRNGRNYKVERVISVHPFTNLALIKVEQSRGRLFEYLNPAKQSFTEKDELLVFAHEDDLEDGFGIEQVETINYLPLLSRSGLTTMKAGSRSMGGPAINNRGEVCGIINGHPSKDLKVIYNTYLLNDSNWVDINVKLNNDKTASGDRKEMNPSLSYGFYYLLANEPIEAARQISLYLRNHPKDGIALSLRGLSRYRYNNKVGSREDFETARKVAPHSYLQFYFKAQLLLEEDKKDEAAINYEICLDKQPNFAPAIVRLAMLNLDKTNDVRRAYSYLTEATLHDSLEATAYYERARLSMQYSDNTSKTLADVNKTIYLNPNLAGIYTIRGTIRSDAQDLLGAIADFDRAIEKDATDVHAYFNRGIAHYNIGLRPEACKDWSKAGELGNYQAYKHISRYCKQNK